MTSFPLGKRFGLQTKMFAFGLLLACISLAVGGAGYLTVTNVALPYDKIVHESNPDLLAVTNLLSSIRLTRTYVRSMAIEDLTAAEQSAVHKGLLKGVSRLDEDLKLIPSLHIRNAAAAETISIAKDAFNREHKIFLDLAKLEGSRASERARVDELIRQDIEVAPEVAQSFEKVEDLFKSENEASVRLAESNHRSGIQFLFALMTVGVVVAIGSAYFFARSMSRVFLRISEELANSASEVASASQQISQASHQLSSGATEAAASLEETVASIEELSSVVKLNASHATDAATFSENTQSAAEGADAEILKLVTAVTEIATSSKKIEEIINVIDDIAFQTNLLALNAAVEAARAGEQGKGFAVVAEAVRALAQRSSVAAKDITTLIKESVSRAENGATLADRSGTVLKQIVGSVQKITALNSEIASGSREQSTGLSQISQAMNQLDQATQGNAASAEEVAATSQQMAEQADSLKELVVELRSLVHGRSA